MRGFQYRLLNTVIAGLAGSKRIRVLRRIVLLPEVFMANSLRPILRRDKPGSRANSWVRPLRKQRLSIYERTLGLSHGAFDAPHPHVEPAPMEPTVTVALTASGNSTTRPTLIRWFGLQDFTR